MERIQIPNRLVKGIALSKITHVAKGKILRACWRVLEDGLLVVSRKIENVATGHNNQPKFACVIAKCGQISKNAYFRLAVQELSCLQSVLGNDPLVVRKIESVATGANNRPKLACIIAECGEM
ncbi:hypothetical protein SO802_008708 [Lithocarpus litseifolius]|uniref:Uncharacterized protein n=1 Tax=Lithocarpus litseifolius TaxID=425828 RepID=A0AAW2DF00_9ROSI